MKDLFKVESFPERGILAQLRRWVGSAVCGLYHTETQAGGKVLKMQGAPVYRFKNSCYVDCIGMCRFTEVALGSVSLVQLNPTLLNCFELTQTKTSVLRENLFQLLM